MLLKNNFDVLVVGGGHAGTEAASASARMGMKTLLLTNNIDTLGKMSCNPSIGGIGKSHLVKEIDALGGLMGKAADAAGIQFRVLNTSKGAAVRSTRAQCDRILYKQSIYNFIFNQNNLSILQDNVNDLIIKNNKIIGIITQIGNKIYSHTVVLTVGTFLSGRIHIGINNYEGGRSGENSSTILSKKLRNLGLTISRLKTGTPPRLDKRSVNLSLMKKQYSDIIIKQFSNFQDINHPQQIPCYITYTNKNTHDIILKNIKSSSVYNGTINGLGPRYCPSIEDKIFRFANKQQHQIFLEPEGLNSIELYPNGISTSLPFNIQREFIKTIEGLENAYITRPGYAIEYDFFDPKTNLFPHLEVKNIENLFFAGQINGTTGYEEAAGQGIIAGINAALKVQRKSIWVPKRSEAYIGVMIDDLITKGIQEPYRMFTSRAEYRLMLREDNADIRLSQIAIELGLLKNTDKDFFVVKKKLIAQSLEYLKSTYIYPKSIESKNIKLLFQYDLKQHKSLFDILKMSIMTYESLYKIKKLPEFILNINNNIMEHIEITAKYSGYIEKQQKEIYSIEYLETNIIPKNFEYNKVYGLSNEVKEILEKYRPYNLAHASRIQGITPVSISILIIYMKKVGILNK